ncbi:hypothetical protein B0H63DRAFT_103204 [Podospora didyma]|uniref:Mucoidy inhibitor-like protein n=1 Tax=Podospora didyma TaxID=330526 RepID=A0AAE0U3X8_9PEZI|nr:hypothetical protein B0H63DRAFT_103204 [Podospora didyma]
MEAPHKREYRIRDLPTRSVTLFPTRAQIVRDIKDVALKPGANEIIIVGLSPTVDEHSIKVEGTGSATITDLNVVLLPNTDIFQEIYPDSDSESEQDKSDEEDEEEQDKINKALEEVRDKLVALGDEQQRAQEIISSAETRLKILDSHGLALDKREQVDIESSVETYRTERAKVFQDHIDGLIRVRTLDKEVGDLKKEEARLLKLDFKEKMRAAKAKAKVQRAKEKIKDKERRREAERQKEKARIRAEREQFWPRSCYTVRITLDVTNFGTPSSSRRSSIASASDLVKVAPEKESSKEGDDLACSLTLSYVTWSAFWSPSYDLTLSTINNTASLCFDAQLTNMTSETWSNCKVILSTSQTTFAGVLDTIPTLQPWRVKLAGRGYGGSVNDLIDSREERAEKNAWNVAQAAQQQQKPRAALFGVNATPDFGQPPNDNADYQMQLMLLEQQNKKRLMMARQEDHSKSGQPQQQYGQQMAMQQMQMQQAQVGGGMRGAFGGFGSAAPASAPQAPMAYMSNAMPMRRKEAGGGRGGASMMKSAKMRSSSAAPGGGDDSEEEFSEGGAAAYDGATVLEATPDLDFEESTFEETGLTATYDLPSLKTLKPNSTASKQRVARVNFTSVTFSRTVVAKYKPVAYLRARMRNASKLTLLRGPTGLTLDGTFMGRSTLPRCSSGEAFSMSLGVDPAIRVIYPKPDVKRSTTGVFTKGDNSIYTRTITLANTRGGTGKPVSITVLDQVPVSEDEKLRIDVREPRGLTSVGSEPVNTGQPGREGKDEKNWGKATAQLKKAGELVWEVQLNPGRCAKLTLEYEVALPAGERVMQCD